MIVFLSGVLVALGWINRVFDTGDKEIIALLSSPGWKGQKRDALIPLPY